MRSTEKVKKEVLILNTIQMLQRTTVQLLVESIWVQLDICTFAHSSAAQCNVVQWEKVV